MGNYIFTRLLWFIPALLFLSFLTFMISAYAPKNEGLRLDENWVVADRQLQMNREELGTSQNRFWQNHGLHLPLFYIEIGSLAGPDTLYRIRDRKKRKAATRLLMNYGNWPLVQRYLQALDHLYFAHDHLQIKDANQEALLQAISLLQQLQHNGESAVIIEHLTQLEKIYRLQLSNALLRDLFIQLRGDFEAILEHPSRWKTYIPRLIIHGSDNQYHRWLSAVVGKLDFGRSYYSGQAVGKRMGERIKWSMIFAIVSILLGYFISIPLGILMAIKAHSRFDRLSSLALFALDAIPAFLGATLLLLLFANADGLNLFPSSFVLPVKHSANSAEMFLKSVHSMILPLIAYTYGAMAFLSRSMRAAMLEVLNCPYILAAKARGVPRSTIYWRHALANALLPMITLFVSIFPALVGGAVVIEYIFGIPGMGREVFLAVMQKDIPMIMAIFGITGVLSMLAYLISDILYAWIDPRIKDQFA